MGVGGDFGEGWTCYEPLTVYNVKTEEVYIVQLNPREVLRMMTTFMGFLFFQIKNPSTKCTFKIKPLEMMKCFRRFAGGEIYFWAHLLDLFHPLHVEVPFVEFVAADDGHLCVAWILRDEK